MPETAKITIISANFLVWKYCRKAQFPSCGWFARKLGEIAVFFVVRENLAVTYMSEKFIYKLNILMYIRHPILQNAGERYNTKEK